MYASMPNDNNGLVNKVALQAGMYPLENSVIAVTGGATLYNQASRRQVWRRDFLSSPRNQNGWSIYSRKTNIAGSYKTCLFKQVSSSCNTAMGFSEAIRIHQNLHLKMFSLV